MKTVSNLLIRIPPLFADLAKILAGEIDCSQTTLAAYSNDYSPYTVLPQAVVYPKNVTDIKHILSFAREYTMPVTVRGKGRARNGGALGEGIILDTSRYFSQIRTVNMMENIVTVDAGTSLSSLIEKLHGWHLDIPLISQGDKETTVGALIATKSAETGSFRHGSISEWIESITVVVDTGEEHKITEGITPSGRLLGIYQAVFPLLTQEGGILRAAKPLSHDDATGYNLWNTTIGPRQLIDQLTGSEGTLGIITSVTFRTTPYKPHQITTCIPIADKKYIPSIIEIAKHHGGEHIFLYDTALMQLAEKYYPTVVPFFTDAEYIILVTHTGNDKEKLHQIVRSFKRTLPVEDYLLKTLDDEKKLERITDSDFLFSLFSSYTNDTLLPVTSGDGLIVPLHSLPAFLKKLEVYLDFTGKVYAITGNVGSGHVSVITLFDPRAQRYDEDLFVYSNNLFAIVKEFDGGISAVGGEGLSRTPFLSYVYNEAALSVFKKIKEAWDPLYILNPGKKLGTTPSYLQHHLKRIAPTEE